MIITMQSVRKQQIPTLLDESQPLQRKEYNYLQNISIFTKHNKESRRNDITISKIKFKAREEANNEKLFKKTTATYQLNKYSLRV